MPAMSLTLTIVMKTLGKWWFAVEKKSGAARGAIQKAKFG